MDRTRSPAKCLAPFLALVAVACAGPEDSLPPGTKMPEVGLDGPPGFDVGDRFQFDNPTVTWSVVAIEEGRAQWESDAGDAQITEMNPLLPALEWKSESQGSGKRLISGVEGSLFPLRIGAKTNFRSTVSMDRPPYAWEANWVCEVTGVKQIEVPAGNFTTFEVVCIREGVDENRFLYAPDLGHWVVSSSRQSHDGPLRSRQLVAFTKARASTLVIGTDPAGETVMRAERAPEVVTSEAPPAAADPTPMPKPEPATTPKQTASRPTAQPADAGQGGFALHVASYKNQSSVDPGWRLLKQRHGTVLAPYEPVVRRVDLGRKGIFFRLMAGPISDRSAAVAQCKLLSARGQYCKVLAL